jgi:hypothetical protein
MHPEVIIFVMVITPGVMPVSTPVADPTVATAGLLLVHVPEPVEIPKVDEVPWQMVWEPVITGITTAELASTLQQPETDKDLK